MKCEKCGSEDLDTQFVQYGQLIDSSSTRRVENEFIWCSEYDFFYKLSAAKDHLKITCGNCGYSYRTNTLDDRA